MEMILTNDALKGKIKMNLFIASHYLKNNIKIKRSSWAQGTYLKLGICEEVKIYHKDWNKSVTLGQNGKPNAHHVSDTEFKFEPHLDDLLAEDYEVIRED